MKNVWQSFVPLQPTNVFQITFYGSTIITRILTSGAIVSRCRISPGTERMLSINKLLRLSEKLLRISGLKEI